MDKVATRILASLHRIEEDDFKSEDVIFTNVEAVDAAGVSLPPTLPAVVYFKNSEPVVYKGQSQKYHFLSIRVTGPTMYIVHSIS